MAADLAGVNLNTDTLNFHNLCELIAFRLAETKPWDFGEIDVGRSRFNGPRKGKRKGTTAYKVPLSGLLERDSKIHVVITLNYQQKGAGPDKVR